MFEIASKYNQYKLKKQDKCEESEPLRSVLFSQSYLATISCIAYYLVQVGSRSSGILHNAISLQSELVKHGF